MTAKQTIYYYEGRIANSADGDAWVVFGEECSTIEDVRKKVQRELITTTYYDRFRIIKKEIIEVVVEETEKKETA
jgi:hypothetical protein